jgi:hypothetical protein
MKNRLHLVFEYFLIGALGLLPILLITQIVLTVESILRESLVGIYGRFVSILLDTSSSRIRLTSCIFWKRSSIGSRCSG